VRDSSLQRCGRARARRDFLVFGLAIDQARDARG
jgi:hypothetical protein